MAGGSFVNRLVLPPAGLAKTLVSRVVWVFVLVFVAWAMLWLERDGLRDARGLPAGPMDVLYFAVVTLTTLGYGDIVPVSNEARAMVTFGITPLRVLVFLVLLSTAYELVLKRSIEQFEMQKLKRSLSDHTVVCGFGVKGRAAVNELMARGLQPNQIIVIEKNPTSLEEAAMLGIAGIRGDAASERNLRDAAIETAASAIVATNSDESTVLVCLTIRELSPNVRIFAAAREDENVKLIRRSGADTVVAPSANGGRLLAAASSSPWSSEIVAELFEHGRGADLFDVKATAEMVGRLPRELESQIHGVVVGVHTQEGKTLTLRHARQRKVAEGDTLLVLTLPADGSV